MTIVHMVMFKFRAEVSQAHKDQFVKQLKDLKTLPCVQQQRLYVGGPSITDPIDRSKGFQYALVSFHQNAAALADYQASKEHHNVTSKLLFPYYDDLVRFDFDLGDHGASGSQFVPVSSEWHSEVEI